MTTTTRITNTLLALSIAFSLSFTSMSSGSAQEQRGYVRRVHVMGAEETGILNPAGLAYSASSQSFYVIEEQSGEQALAASSEIKAITPFADALDLTRVGTALEDPRNIVFDNQNQRLLAFQGTTGDLLEVRQNPGGRLDKTISLAHNLAKLGIQEPVGLALDEGTGSLFILDAVGPRIVRVQPAAGRNFSAGKSSVIDLSSSGLVAPHGIAFDAATGHLHVLDSSDQTLYELAQNGNVVTTRSLAAFDLKSPQAMVFAPSGDQTDDPAQLNLFIADSGLITDETSTSATDTGEILELSLVEPAVEAATINFTSTVVRMTDMSTILPPGPDPSGLAYLPVGNRLMVSDGEVEEVAYNKTHFQGANVWELTLSGSVIRTANISPVAPTVVPMSDEPTGVAWNPNNNHFYFSDDTGSIDLYDLNPGSDGLVGTSDDTWIGLSLGSYGVGDAEGIAYDTWNNTLWVVDGVNAEVYQLTLNGTLISQFDVARYGVVDPESVEFNPDTGTLFVMSSDNSSPIIVETTLGGALLQTISISSANARVPAGLAYGPASDGSGVRRFYIVDRGYDNNENGNLIDGKLFEMTTPAPGPTPTASNTPSITPTLPPAGVSRYLSFASNGTVSGVAFADEDILHFDGQNWSLFFDGSDVGAGSADLTGLSVMDADTILMAFSANVTLNGLAVTPQDIVRFDATSLGTSTAGTFSLYFKGANVGFDTTAEKIDALSLLPDGRVLISTTGNPSVPGISARDEDVLAFTPTTLGANTSGAWSMYFDGSDVGMGDATSEDIDALSVVAGQIYLSTNGVFSVSGASGAGEDVFICTPTSLGDATACSFTSALFFDGSTWGLAGNSMDGFFLSGTSSPTTPTPTATGVVTPTDTPTPTSLFTPTNTPTPTPTSLFTPTNTLTPTATSSSGSEISTFTPNADAYVRSSDPTINYGTVTTLRAYQSGSSVTNSHLRFSVTGITGPVQSAKLRLYVTDASSIGGGTLYQTVDNNWTEMGINYTNQPSTTGSALATLGPVSAGIWIEIDVSSLVTADGVYTFGLLGNSSDAAYYASRETLNRPQLVVTYANLN